ncbi:MAG TPA: hypothetical protein V6D00_04640 [Pantanalinema sp.]
MSMALASALLLSACGSAQPSVEGNAKDEPGFTVRLDLAVTPGSYRSQATAPPNTSASIHHLVVKLFRVQGNKEVPIEEKGQPITADVSGAALQSPVFLTLKKETDFRARAYAYRSAGLSPSDLISDQAAFVDVPKAKREASVQATLPVPLVDVAFQGQGTAAFVVRAGGYATAGPEVIEVSP